MFSGNDRKVIAIPTLCLSSFEVQLNFNTGKGWVWGEAGPEMDLVPDSAVTHGIVQNKSPDVHSRTQKKSV